MRVQRVSKIKSLFRKKEGECTKNIWLGPFKVDKVKKSERGINSW
jgi:hypothetical protein